VFTDSAPLQVCSLASVTAPAECLFIYDSHDENLEDAFDPAIKGDGVPDTEAWEWMDSWVQGVRAGQTNDDKLIANFPSGPWRHSTMLNILWLDGHAKARRFSSLQQKDLNIQNQNYTIANDPNWPE
jgi:prepilin-type processing-associated H-X9-DG protein